jgi:CheY-like chemotaxis protein
VRELFAEALRRQGARVQIACDGAEALAKAEPGRFDAIVLDLSMPEVEGDEVARRIRERDRTVRLVGVSAHADARDHARAIAAGMDGFLPKPVSLAALFAFLRPGAEPTSAGEAADLQPLWERMHRDFTEGCPGVAANLDHAWQRRDWRALARLAHHLKGSADLLGFRDLSAACAAIYAAAETRSERGAGEGVRALHKAVSDVAAACARGEN